MESRVNAFVGIYYDKWKEVRGVKALLLKLYLFAFTLTATQMSASVKIYRSQCNHPIVAKVWSKSNPKVSRKYLPKCGEVP